MVAGNRNSKHIQGMQRSNEVAYLLESLTQTRRQNRSFLDTMRYENLLRREEMGFPSGATRLKDKHCKNALGFCQAHTQIVLLGICGLVIANGNCGFGGVPSSACVPRRGTDARRQS